VDVSYPLKKREINSFTSKLQTILALSVNLKYFAADFHKMGNCCFVTEFILAAGHGSLFGSPCLPAVDLVDLHGVGSGSLFANSVSWTPLSSGSCAGMSQTLSSVTSSPGILGIFSALCSGWLLSNKKSQQLAFQVHLLHVPAVMLGYPDSLIG